ncbi:uncharacterized protein PAC_07667 [Phialocephala subalpina]|uniref:Uncharacterized protein n=1 Tax=Phialocephala subalpina TaxID=576137 RepID=A0A1L7WYD6_9HELO|nr:uncharacterized protein PAC_07667 [Phialocephala subalpina]
MSDSVPLIASEPLSPTTELTAIRTELQLLKNHAVELGNIIQNQNSQISQFETYFNNERQTLATYQDGQSQLLQRSHDEGFERLRERDALLQETIRLEKKLEEDNVECNAHIGDLTRQNQELKEALEREIAEHRDSNADLQSCLSGIDASTQTDRDHHVRSDSGTQSSEPTIDVLVFNRETKNISYKQITSADYRSEFEKYQELILQHEDTISQLQEHLAHAVKNAKVARASREQVLDAMEEMETAAEEANQAIANGRASPEVQAVNYLKQLKACQEELATKKTIMGEAMSIAHREAAEACAERDYTRAELEKLLAVKGGDDCEEKLKKCDDKLKKTFQRAEEHNARYEKAAKLVLGAYREHDQLNAQLDDKRAKTGPETAEQISFEQEALDNAVQQLINYQEQLADLRERYEATVNDSNAARLGLDQAMLEIERLEDDEGLRNCFEELTKTREQLANLSEVYEKSLNDSNAARLGLNQAMLKFEGLESQAAEQANDDEQPFIKDCPEHLMLCHGNLAKCNEDKEKLGGLYEKAINSANGARKERDDALEKLEKANKNLEAMIRGTPSESSALRTCEKKLLSLCAQLNVANQNAQVARVERDQAIEAQNQSILDNESVTTVGSDQDTLTSNGSDDNDPLPDCEIKFEIAQTAPDNTIEELNQARRGLAERTAERNGAAFRVQVLEAGALEAQDRELALQQMLDEEREGDSLAVTLEEELYDCGTNLEAMTDERDAAVAEVERLNAQVMDLEMDVSVIRAFSVSRGQEAARLESVVEDMERERENSAAEVEQRKYEVEKVHAEELERALDTAEASNEKLEKTTKYTSKNLKKCKEENTAVEAQIEILTQNNNALAAQTGVPQAALDDTIAQRDEAQHQLEELEKKLKACRSEARNYHTTGVELFETANKLRRERYEISQEREECREALKAEKQKAKETSETAPAQEQDPTQHPRERSNAPSPETSTAAKAVDTLETLKDFMTRLTPGDSREKAAPRRSTRSTRNQAPDYDVGPAPRETRSRKRKAAKGEGSGSVKKKR